jgi:hypothetical protein
MNDSRSRSNSQGTSDSNSNLKRDRSNEPKETVSSNDLDQATNASAPLTAIGYSLHKPSDIGYSWVLMRWDPQAVLSRPFILLGNPIGLFEDREHAINGMNRCLMAQRQPGHVFNQEPNAMRRDFWRAVWHPAEDVVSIVTAHGDAVFQIYWLEKLPWPNTIEESIVPED